MSAVDMPSSLAENFVNSAGDASPIQDYLRGKTVFLTGGFGFIGKLSVQKLLKCDVKRIYMIVRGKKGKSVQDRLEVLRADPVFEKLLKENNNAFDKLTLFEGDMKLIGLGLSSENRATIIREVELVFHAAADVRFDESLKEVTEINVRGTREIMLLSQEIQNLNVFVYVSTAFCTPGFYVKEKFYQTNLDPDFMINVVEHLRPEDYDAFDAIARRIIQPYPNTYTYTKALAEHIVRKYSGNMKVAISRPAIISTTYADPIPGYTDNVYGVNGVVAGAGVGILRILHINNDCNANIVPADFVVNSIIGAAWFTMLENSSKNKSEEATENKALSSYQNFYHDFSQEKIKIYQCTVPDKNSLTWGNVQSETIKIGIKSPVRRCLWIITYNTTKYYYLCQFLKVFYHFLPALIFDTALGFMGKQPKLMKVYRKVNKFSDVIAFFTTNEWSFEYGNTKRMYQAMSKRDKILFNCNMEKLDWLDFFQVFCAGIRKYIIKESDESIPDGKKKYRQMQFMHYTLMSVVYSFMAFIAYHILKFYGFIDLGADLFKHSKTSYAAFR